MSVFYKNKGAISVFLVIILVPCMLVSSIFVDISRVELSKAVAESSADLALNTLMSNYDYDLSDYYGLIGSCNNISEFYDTVSGFYETGLHSRDLEDDEIKLLYQEIANEIEDRFQNETFSDILQIENQTEGSVVGPVKDANMYNAAILQKQVVEFMKYRGPVVIVQDLIEKINNDPGLSSFLDGEKNKPLPDKKTDFYKAEGELLEVALDVYWKTRDYTDKVQKEGMSTEKLQKYADSLDGYRTAYKKIHECLVGNLINTEHLKDRPYTRVTIDLDKYVGTYKIEGESVASLFADLEQAETELEDAISNFSEACDSLMNTLPGDGEGDAHPIQWWVQMDKTVNAGSGTNYTDEIADKADAMAKAYAKVSAVDQNTEEDMPDDWESTQKDLLEKAESLHDTYLTADQEDEDDDYLKAVNKLEAVTKNYVAQVDAQKLIVDTTIDGRSNYSVAEALARISSSLNDLRQSMNSYIKLLDLLLKPGENEDKCPLDKLIDATKKYNTTLNAWEETAGRTNTGMGRDHQKEIDGIRKNKTDTEEEIQLEIDEREVKVLKDRLTAIQSQFRVLYDAVEKLQYGESYLAEISEAEQMKSEASEKVSNDAIGLTRGQVKSYADSTFSSLFQPLSGTIAELYDLNDSKYNPIMRPDKKEVDTPDLYLYLHLKFKDKPRDAAGDAKADQDDANSIKEEKEKEKDKNRFHGKAGTDITATSASSEGKFNLGSSLFSTMFGLVDSLVHNRAYNLRDNLYATAYIMHMFSYATYETEGYYSLVPDEKKTKLRLPGAGGYYPSEYDQYKGGVDQPGTWLSEDEEDSYNKSLTNKMINEKNDHAYLAEIEYILYGGTNEENVKSAYGDIFLIRYPLNLVSAFVNFWASSNTTSQIINAIATTIAGMTAGIVPPPVTKVILLPILTLFETLKDLDRLEAGFPVELYKVSDEDWWCSVPKSTGKNVGISGFLRALTGDRENPGKGLQYSDYLTLFVCMGMMQGNNVTEGMYLRMADVIQANMRKVTGKKDYSLTKTQVYFYLKSKLRVDPLMLTLPIFSEETQDLEMKEDWCTFNVEIIRGY